jgi:hypothetical protein
MPDHLFSTNYSIITMFSVRYSLGRWFFGRLSLHPAVRNLLSNSARESGFKDRAIILESLHSRRKLLFYARRFRSMNAPAILDSPSFILGLEEPVVIPLVKLFRTHRCMESPAVISCRALFITDFPLTGRVSTEAKKDGMAVAQSKKRSA